MNAALSHVSEESHQSSTCFRFFLFLARFEYSLLALEENERDQEVSLLVLLPETCSESPHLSDPSSIFLHEPATGQRPHDFGQREPIARDKLRMFLKSTCQASNPFVQQHIYQHVTPDPLKSFDITETRTEFQTRDVFLAGEHASPGKLKLYRRSEIHQGVFKKPHGAREGKITH